MKIGAIQHVVPTRSISNDDCLQFLEHQLRDCNSEAEVHRATNRLEQFLDACGTNNRQMSEPGETALDFMLKAGREALQVSEVPPEEIEFVIYCGVSRGWIEPATATVVQSELGLKNATCFDIVEACASWLRALQVAHSLIRGGSYRCGLIVNCECGLQRLSPMKIKTADELETKLAAFTLGEAATATVVSASDEDDFYFRFRSFGEHFGLCMIPLPSIREYLPRNRNGHAVPDSFYTESEKLIGTSLKQIVREFKLDPKLTGGSYDAIFSHSASSKASQFVGSQLGLPRDRFVDLHPTYGNTVSASVPLGMSLAVQEGRLKRGHKVLVIMGSAGITIGFATFTF